VAVGPGNAGLTGVAVSRDGRWLYANVGERPGTSRIDLSLPVARRMPEPLPPLPGGKPFQVWPGAGSPDDRWILGAARQEPGPTQPEAYLYDVERRSYRRIAWPGDVSWLGWLPDSRRLLVQVARTLSIFDTQTESITPVYTLEKNSDYPELSFDGRWLFTQRIERETQIYMLDFGASK
jgi:hypothetical protein